MFVCLFARGPGAAWLTLFITHTLHMIPIETSKDNENLNDVSYSCPLRLEMLNIVAVAAHGDPYLWVISAI
jgi:hypothetical protein